MKRWLITTAVILNVISACYSKKCYNCINFVCPHPEPNTCNQIEDKVLEVVRAWIQISQSSNRQGLQRLRACPEPGDEERWKILEESTSSQCESNLGACAMTRFEVRLQNEKYMQISEHISYGTILGCDTPKRMELFPRVLGGSEEVRCSMTTEFRDAKEFPQKWALYFENCAGQQTNVANSGTCWHDFCTNKTAALPRRFHYLNSEFSTRSWVTMMLICILIIITAFCMEDIHLYIPPPERTLPLIGQEIHQQLQFLQKQTDLVKQTQNVA